MRIPWITGEGALRERMQAKQQAVSDTAPEAELPPYLESFLAHLRLLVGVPFPYLIPDARLLPPESVRFFYLDRSWTDRLVDGALAVGKIGTREQAHHHGAHGLLTTQLDVSERIVRGLQRGHAFADEKAAVEGKAADYVTGFLMRSALVSGWPHMDVRAFDTELPLGVTPAEAEGHRVKTLRLERLSASVLLAIFDGIPKLVWCEEPHHGVQLGVTLTEAGGFAVRRRRPTGEVEVGLPPGTELVSVPVRATHRRVVHVRGLRRALHQLNDPQMPAQTGAAALTVELLQPPWRQRFQGGERAPDGLAFDPSLRVAHQVETPGLIRLLTLVTE